MRRERGQLTIGLALAFTAVCAIFGLLFNSAMMTREKMKLQQTTDFAALMGAQVQRVQLNQIREINEAIELLFAEYQIYINAPHCDAIIVGCDFDPSCVAGIANVYAPDTTHTACEDSCKDIDNVTRDTIVMLYEALRNEGAAWMATILEEGNQNAYEYVLQTFLSWSNLPHGLKRILAKKLGDQPTFAAIKDEYLSGGLSRHFRIDKSYSQMPLFDGADESRQFIYITYNSQTYTTPPPASKELCTVEVPNGAGATSTNAKVVRVGNLTTHYMTNVAYTPPNTFVDENFSYKLRKTGSDHVGSSEIKNPSTQQPLRLFNVTDETTGESKTTLAAMALAKPYGGTFPTPGAATFAIPESLYDPSFLFDYGKVGDKFTGAKLIGIADHEELDGYEIWKANGFPLPTGEFLQMEDFLH